jgi:hypothetical protein
MRESSVGMFRSDVGMARFTMLNGFFQVLNPFVQMCVFATPLSKVHRLFCMCHEHLSMALFAMVHRSLEHSAQIDQIMTEILSRLIDAGVSYLPVHDAIYTSLSQVVETLRVMKSVFKGMVGVEGMMEDEGIFIIKSEWAPSIRRPDF